MSLWQGLSMAGAGVAVGALVTALVVALQLVREVRERHRADHRYREARQRADELAKQLDLTVIELDQVRRRSERAIEDLMADVDRCVQNYDELDDDQLRAELERISGGIVR